MIYTLDQIRELVEPVAIKLKLQRLWVYGSYARGEQTENSDIDLLMDDTASTVVSLYDLVNISDEFEKVFNKKIDLVSTGALFHRHTQAGNPDFVRNVSQERVILYAK
jgi:predicted nucleotidyltransferase